MRVFFFGILLGLLSFQVYGQNHIPVIKFINTDDISDKPMPCLIVSCNKLYWGDAIRESLGDRGVEQLDYFGDIRSDNVVVSQQTFEYIKRYVTDQKKEYKNISSGAYGSYSISIDSVLYTMLIRTEAVSYFKNLNQNLATNETLPQKDITEIKERLNDIIKRIGGY